MQLQVKELKAVAVIADLSEAGSSVTSDQCMTVEHFDYQCARKRDSRGVTYGASMPSDLHFTVRINNADQTKPVYQQLMETENNPITFIFNATFSDNKRLSAYDDAMVIEGFVIEVAEAFQSAALDAQKEEQILLRARMQVRSLTYIGQDNNTKQLAFVQ